MRSRRWPSLLVVVALLVAGCSSDPGDERIDLGADGSSAEDADGEMDGSSAEDDDGSSAEETPLYPPLPPLDPDPTSDVSIEDQRFFLDLHMQFYDLTQSLAADPDGDLRVLEEVASDPALSELVGTIERWREDGLVLLSPDTTIEWVAVAEAAGGPGIVEECRRYGERSGLYVDGDLVEPSGSGAFIVQTRYEVIEREGELGTYAVEVGVVEDGDRCA